MKIRELLFFQKSDRKVLLFLFIVAAVAIALICGVGNNSSDSNIAIGDSIKSLLHLSKSDRRQHKGGLGDLPQRPVGELFYFDPNTVDSTAMRRLGFSNYQIISLYKYRAAGAVFQSAEDFTRFRALTAGEYKRLKPYIRISDEFLPASEVYKEAVSQSQRDTVKHVVKVSPGVKLPINASDTTAFKTIPGIGSYYAKQIVDFRERLGGYVEISQLEEIEGFPTSALGYFQLDETTIKKLNLNTASVSKLKYHPYIDFHQARAIYDYRRLKGPLQSLEDLRLLKYFTPSDIERIAPYVEF